MLEQDIDAAYIFDDDCDLDASLSALLEVPSLDYSQFDAPVTTTHNMANGSAGNMRSSLNVGEPLLHCKSSLAPSTQQRYCVALVNVLFLRNQAQNSGK